MVIFPYNLNVFVWIYHGCFTNMVYVLDPKKRDIMRLWCIGLYVAGLLKSKMATVSYLTILCLFSLLLYIYGKQVKSCQDNQLSLPHFS